MLHMKIEGNEFFNEDTQEFIQVKSRDIIMEHSLLSVSKWEAKWKKPFLTYDDKTQEEYLSYFECMTITPNVDPLLYRCLTIKQIKEIKDYIDDSHTATIINDVSKIMTGPRNSRRSRKVTSELIYYWMITANIYKECEKWHLNRLMTLIQVCCIENNPNKKKMSKQAIYSQNRELNALRKAKYHTKG